MMLEIVQITKYHLPFDILKKNIQNGLKNSLSSQFLAHKVHDEAPDVDDGHPLKSGEVSLPVSSLGEPAESFQGL